MYNNKPHFFKSAVFVHCSLCIVFLLILCFPGSARIFFVGSNPHLTMFAFPQDIFLTGGDAVSYTLRYESLPWWGDVDEHELKPNQNYLPRGERVYYAGGSSLEYANTIHAIKQRAGITRWLSDSLKGGATLTWNVLPMRSRAEGDLPDAGVPFSYREGNSLQDLSLTSILGMYIRDIPVGFKFEIGTHFATRPRLNFQLTDNGTEIESNRLLWGWDITNSSTSNRTQDRYSLGPLMKLDAQAAATFDRLKCGTRLRYHFGMLNFFDWNADDNPVTSLDSTYTGSYINDEDGRIRHRTIRLYGNYTWITHDTWRFNTLLLTRYSRNDTIGVNPRQHDVETGRKKRSRTFVLQCNPNFNFYPWDIPKTYIDAALLCNFSHMRYDYLRNYGVSGGEVESYVGTRAWSDEDYAWQNFSYGRENFFEVALDFNSTFPLYGNRDRSFAAGVFMLLWSRFKWFYKYYGRFHDEFVVENIRKNFDREIWLHSALSVLYRTGPTVFRLDVSQPLIYSLVPRTRVTGPNGKNIESEIKRENMWLSQSGVAVGISVSRSLGRGKRD